MARGSALEVQTQLIIAMKLGYATENRMKPLQALVDEIAKMLWALMEKLQGNRRLIAEY